MITRDEIVPILLKVCPTFEKVLDECQDKELLYVVLDDFGRHPLELRNAGKHHSFKAVAEAVEQPVIKGDSYVRDATTIGLLEGIQNVWGSNHVDPEFFRQFLLPGSLLWLNELNAFWQGERRLVGEGVTRNLSSDEVAKIREEVRMRFQK